LRHAFLNTHNPKIRKARKPINAIRITKILPRTPKPPSNPKNLETIPNTASSNQTTPVKNPRKIPKMLQEEWSWLIDIHPLSMVVQDYSMQMLESLFIKTQKEAQKRHV
jgi:hypothetical protein